MTSPTYENIIAKTVMNHVNSAAMPFAWSINPYRGCTHGCSFCYARSTHSYMGKAADDSFRTEIFVKVNAAKALEIQLEKLAKRHKYNLTTLAEEIGLVQIGTATDPYQPIEARVHVTRQCLEVLQRFRVPVSITTRSPLILRDLDVLQNMDVRAICISVHTLDKVVWKNLEPSTPSPLKRLETVRTLGQHQIKTGILLAPVIPWISDQSSELEAVIRAAREYGAKFLSPSVLRLDPEVKEWFFHVVAEKYPHEHLQLRRMYKSEYAPEWYKQKFMQRVEPLMKQYGFTDYERTQLSVQPRRDRNQCEYMEGASVQLALPI